MTHVIEVPFHIGDFLSGTMHMDATEIGAYWMLCVAHYQAGEQGLPDDDVKLARIAKVTPKIWKRIRPTLEDKFEITDSFWRSKKVVEVLLKISDRSTNAKAKALKRWNADDATALPQQCHGNANQQPYNQEPKEVVVGDAREPAQQMEIVSRETKPELPNAPRKTFYGAAYGDRIGTITGWIDDPRWMGNYSRLTAWIEAGWDFELDIVPTIERLMASRRASGQGPPSTLTYFEKAIADAHARRMKPLPEGNANERPDKPKSALDAHFTGFSDAVARNKIS